MSLPVAILAGGLATRLKPISETIPKVLVDVAGLPFAVRQIELLKQQGLTHLIFCVGHLGEQVQHALGDGSRWEVRLEYSFDGEKLMGTGGALSKALPLLGEAFFVLYGDAYLQCDYQGAEKFFRQSQKEGLMTVFRNANQWDTSNVVFREGHIAQYDKKHRTPQMDYIDYGLGILRASVFQNYVPETPLDLADIYQQLVAREQLAGFEVSQRFYEIGSLAGLDEARRYFAAQTLLRSPLNELYATASS